MPSTGFTNQCTWVSPLPSINWDIRHMVEFGGKVTSSSTISNSRMKASSCLPAHFDAMNLFDRFSFRNCKYCIATVHCLTKFTQGSQLYSWYQVTQLLLSWAHLVGLSCDCPFTSNTLRTGDGHKLDVWGTTFSCKLDVWGTQSLFSTSDTLELLVMR